MNLVSPFFFFVYQRDEIIETVSYQIATVYRYDTYYPTLDHFVGQLHTAVRVASHARDKETVGAKAAAANSVAVPTKDIQQTR